MSRTMAKLHRDDLADEFARLVAKALMDAGPSERVFVACTGGDPQRLRGIPAIGRCVSGAIRGTDPEREAMR